MQSNRIRRVVFFVLGRSVLFAASAGLNLTHAETSGAVIIKDFMFSPMALTIRAGSTVTWKNMDGEPHTVVNDAGMFRSAALDQNDTYQYKFDKPGVYKVFCGIHPNMKETITVQ